MKERFGESMNRIFTKRVLPLVLAAGLVLGLGGCSRRLPEQGDIPDSIDGLSEGIPSSEEQEAVQPEAKQEQSVQENQSSQQSEEEKTPPQDQLAGEKPEDKPQEGKPEEKPEDLPEKEEQSQQTITPVSSGLDTTKLGWGPGGPTDEKNRPSGATAYQEKYGKYDADFIAEDQMKIYLTFDEGYENGYTDDILDVLKEKQTPAVFFVTQPYVKAEPELVQRMIDEGHIVGNHSVNHLSMPTISMEDCRAEVMGLHEYVKENFGYEMNLFRFPMGEFSEADLSLLQQLGYRSVFWSFAYRDWLVDEQPDPQQAIETIESKCHPGAIYLLHAVSQTNAQVLGQVIDDLRAQGYTFCAYGE